ncbi:type VI secretion protein [Colidextribacter sp. 210702-DFI.3.9]|uniref:VirB4 family type IV secretion system protein n=1 Tax=Flavonifractor plautii TaxID=292800 RepID=UPI001D069F83|nr:type VI secretion protein [Colidextribacter sp. 210702-DFI.3.9]
MPRPAAEEPYIKDFLDMVAPSVIDFKVDHYLCGNTCRCVWALREYPTSTDEQAILRHLGEMDGVTIRIYTRQVTPSEERRIIHNAANKHRMSRSSTEDLQQTVTAEANLQDVVTLVSSMHRNREPLLHCAVFLELTAPDYDALKLLQTDVLTELVRSKLNVDRLMLRQQEGFVSVMPAGRNTFGAQFERVLPASSVANLYPFNYSGKTDPHGFYIGKDKYGANILVDFDKRDDDKTSANILILGNSGQGKSYLLKLLLLNFLEAGKSVISLDVEHEQRDMCETVGGCFMDLMGGVYRINPLEPKCWDDGSGPEDRDAPEAFRKSTRLSQHISFLKDFFRAYKDFSDRHIDTIEIMVGKLYAKWGISDSTNFAGLKPEDYPILSDLYELIEQEYREYDESQHQLYTAELLQEILLGLHSMCQGAEAQFFNGHTNVTSSRFIVFGVKGLLQASKNVRGAMLFNILSYMSDRLLTIGCTTAALDELYVWLSDNVSVGTTIIEYIRNTLKRVRKKESNLIMASQNLEDFDREGIRELTKPLFAIPPHQFIFNCGSIDKRFYMDLLQLEEAEYNLIRFPQRGVCLFKCGNERYLLEVHAPAYKEALFGTAGGR